MEHQRESDQQPGLGFLSIFQEKCCCHNRSLHLREYPAQHRNIRGVLDHDRIAQPHSAQCRIPGIPFAVNAQDRAQECGKQEHGRSNDQDRVVLFLTVISVEQQAADQQANRRKQQLCNFRSMETCYFAHQRGQDISGNVVAQNAIAAEIIRVEREAHRPLHFDHIVQDRIMLGPVTRLIEITAQTGHQCPCQKEQEAKQHQHNKACCHPLFCLRLLDFAKKINRNQDTCTGHNGNGQLNPQQHKHKDRQVQVHHRCQV